MLKRLLLNSSIYGLAPNLPKVVAILILPILTAHLTEEDYGIAGTIVAYTMALSAFSTLGFNAVLQSSYFRKSESYKDLWRDIYGFLQLWMIVFSVIQSIILYFIIPKEAQTNRWLIIILTNLNGVIFGPAGFIGPLYYQLEQKPIPIAIRSIISGFLTLLINYITIVIFKWGYMGWYVSSFLGTFIINISYWYSLAYKLDLKPNYHFNRYIIYDKLKVSIPVIPHYYSVYLIQTSGRLIMDWSKIGINNIGIYNIAQQITSYIEIGLNSIERAASPMCMRAIKDNQEFGSKRLIYIFVSITFFLCFLLSLWSKEIFSILIRNAGLASSYPYASILIMALCYRPMYFAASTTYFYYEKTKDILYITFAAGVIALLLNIVFIPIVGLWAAVIIIYISFLYQGYSGFLFKIFKQKSSVRYNYILILLIQLSLTVISFFLLDTLVITKVVITILGVSFFSIIIYTLKQKHEDPKVIIK